MVILGIDPGDWLGWALVQCDEATLDGRLLRGGVIDVAALGEDGAISALVTAVGQRRTCSGATLVAIERVAQVTGRGGPLLRATHADRLVAAAWLGGRLAGYYEGADVRVATPSAAQVRAHFIATTGEHEAGAAKAKIDALAAAACSQRVRGWCAPLAGTGRAYRKDGSDLLADKRAHVADAALAALYAARVGS